MDQLLSLTFDQVLEPVLALGAGIFIVGLFVSMAIDMVRDVLVKRER